MKMSYPMQTRQTRPKKNSSSSFKAIFYAFFALLLINIFFFPYLNVFFLKMSVSSRNFLENQSIISYFKSKQSLQEKNTLLLEKNNELLALNADRNVLQSENEILSEQLNINQNKNYLRANVLERPGFSPYDFLLIDEGGSRGVTVGLDVFYGNIVIGKVVEAYAKSAKVELYSSPGKEFGVLVGNKKLPANAKGLGGGGFLIHLPKEIEMKEGDPVVFQDDPTKVFGFISSISKETSDTFEQVYFTLPINIYEIKNVEIAI